MNPLSYTRFGINNDSELLATTSKDGITYRVEDNQLVVDYPDSGQGNNLHYLDLQGLNEFNERLNRRNRNRLKYKGLLALNKSTRTNWNDLIPAAVGDLYVLTGTEGDIVKINDVEFEVGDTIYVTKRVQQAGSDVTVNKISAGGKAIVLVDELPTVDDAKKNLFYEVQGARDITYYSPKVASYILTHDSILDADLNLVATYDSIVENNTYTNYFSVATGVTTPDNSITAKYTDSKGETKLVRGDDLNTGIELWVAYNESWNMIYPQATQLEDKSIDLNKAMFGESGENNGYEGENKTVSSKYVYDTLKDNARFIKPFYSVTYATYATKAQLDAVDLTTLDENKVYIITVSEDETYPRGTTPQTYDRTQYMVVTVSYDTENKPTRQVKFVGKIDDEVNHPFKIVDELPDLTVSTNVPVNDTAYWLMTDVMDGTVVKYHAGLYIFDKSSTTLDFIRPYEDKNLDTDAVFDGTLTAEYEGDHDKFVDSAYLYEQIKDVSRYIKPFHHLTSVKVNTYADVDTYLATADADAAYLFTVDKDETNTVAATDDHAEYNPTWQYIVVAVQKKTRADGTTTVPSWSKASIGEVTKHEHPIEIVNKLPDVTEASQKPNRNMLYWLKDDVMNAEGTAVQYHAGLYQYDFATNAITHPYESTDLDFEPSYKGTKYLPDTDPNHEEPTYSGDEDVFVDSKYLYNTLDGIIKTLQEQIDDITQVSKNVHYSVVDNITALNAIDLAALADNSLNIFLVADDDTVDHVDGDKTYFKYVADFSEYNYAYLDDPTLTPQKSDIDFDSTIYACACYDDVDYPIVQRQMKFIGKLKYKLHIDDKALDINKMVTGTDSVNSGYDGSESKIASTKYLHDALQDYLRWVSPLHHVKYVTYDTKAALDAVDLTTLDSNVTYVITVKADETYPRGTTPETYDRTQYLVVAVPYDSNSKPTRQAEFIGKIDDEVKHPFRIVDELPDLTDTEQMPVTDVVYWLKADVLDNDGVTVKYHAGLYIFDKSATTPAFKRPYEDKNLDTDYVFDDTLTKVYGGDKDKFVDSEYLFDQLTDFARYVKPFHHLETQSFDTHALMETYIATANSEKAYLLTVKEDETHHVDATTEHDAYDPTWQYLCVAVKQVQRDGNNVPSWGLMSIGQVTPHEHPFAIVKELPDVTVAEQKPNRNMMYWLSEDIVNTDGTTIDYHVGLYYYDLATNEIVHPYEDADLDTDYIFDNTLTNEYDGDQDRFVDSKYLYKQFTDFARYVKPFHNIERKDFDTKAEMDTFVSTADAGKQYLITVKKDESNTVAATAEHAEYDPTWQYIIIATEKDTRQDGTTKVPEWTAFSIGQVTPHEHPVAIVDALPDLTKADEKPNRNMLYWLKADVMDTDGTTVKYHAGIYRYDFTANEISHPYEDTDLDFEPSYKGTKYLPQTEAQHEDPTYSGDADKFVDSKYLYDTLDGVIHTLQEEIDDITGITKTVHYATVDNSADLKALDVTTFESNSMNIILVVDDDEIDHYVDGTGTTISVETYEANPAAYATDTGLKAYYKYSAEFSGYEYSLVNDTTTKPQKSDVDFDSAIYGCVCYDDEMHPVVTREIKFIGKLRYKLHIDSKHLDMNKMITGQDGENEGYYGSESKVASTAYLKDAFEDFFRWVKPLHHIEYKTYATKAELDAVDLSTLDDNKTYIITVTADETYPRGTTPETYDRTQYSVITVSTDTGNKPTRAIEFIGKIDDVPVHPYQIVQELPKAEDIVESTTYLLTKDQKDDTDTLKYTKGTYHFDKTSETFTDLDAKHMRMLGELDLKAETRADWDDLVPCHCGDMWILTSANDEDVVEIDGVEYKPGQFIVVKTEKLTGTGVQVERIASGSDAIKIVDELPETGIKDTVFYAIPNTLGYNYSGMKWYVAKTGTDYTIENDGIHDATSLVLAVTDITSEADIATYCTETTAANAEAAAKYIVTYKITYEDSTQVVKWDTHAKAPFEPTDIGWTYDVQAKKFSVYVYDSENAEWDCIYPIEADSIVYVSDITTVPSPKTTVLYGIRGQTDIHYYAMPQTEIDAGSTIDTTGVHLLGAGVELTFADIAQNPTSLSMTYGFTEATELTADVNTVVTYVDDGQTHACHFPSYNKRADTQVYIYNGATFEKIYPQDSVQNVLVHVQLTRQQYAKVVDGTSVLYTYDENTVYDITDPEHESAPKAYLKNVNILSNNAIIDVTALPSGTEDVAKVDRDSFYRLKNDVLRYSSIAYYNLGAQYYITQTTGSEPHDVVAHLDSGVQVVDISVDQLRADEQAWATNVTTYGIVATTKAAVTANSIVCYKDKKATDPSKYVSASAASFDDEQKVTQIELYFYSDERSEWVCVYPSSVQFEDEDIDFYDEDVWHPIKP